LTDIEEIGDDFNSETNENDPIQYLPENLLDEIDEQNEAAINEENKSSLIKEAPESFRISQRIHKLSTKAKENLELSGNKYLAYIQALLATNLVNESKTLEEASKREDASEWMEAVKQEYDSLIKNDTWSLVELPKDKKPIGCKWIFKLKLEVDGVVDRCKARLVAKKYSQMPGLDFYKKFSLVVKITSLRALLAIAAERGYKVHLMDVKIAFLNGVLDEDIYMIQPPGFAKKGYEHWVCKLIERR
jgi:hypothetical protein